MPNEQTGFQLKINHNGIEHTLQFVFDLSLYSHKIIHGFLANNQLYEPGSSSVLLEVLRPGDTFIDIGAHIGYFTMLASRLVGPTGHVYCFEPEVNNHYRLLNHLQINQMTNVLPFNWAMSNSTGIVNLHTCPGNDGGHGLADVDARYDPEERARVTLQPTFAIPLDSLFSSVQPGAVKAIKLDTEGFELQVLQGMRKLLDTAKVPIVICEINHSLLPHVGVTEQQIRDFMLELGYTIIFDDPQTGQLTPLEATQPAPTNFVFNLVFARPEVIAQKPTGAETGASPA
jgi:FkbM family methyltransferase